MKTKKLLETLCRFTYTDCGVETEMDIYKIGQLADLLGKPKHSVRKAMQKLEADGLVCHVTIGEGEDAIHGWHVTDAVQATEVYKKVMQEDAERYRENLRLEVLAEEA